MWILGFCKIQLDWAPREVKSRQDETPNGHGQEVVLSWVVTGSLSRLGSMGKSRANITTLKWEVEKKWTKAVHRSLSLKLTGRIFWCESNSMAIATCDKLKGLSRRTPHNHKRMVLHSLLAVFYFGLILPEFYLHSSSGRISCLTQDVYTSSTSCSRGDWR